MSKKNYKATKEFLEEIRNCKYTGRELMNMMESRFKMYQMAGYPERLIKFTQLVAKMGEDKCGNCLFGAVLSEIPCHIGKRWRYDDIFLHNDEEWYESYHFLTRLFPEIEPDDYKKVHRMFNDFLLNYNFPLIVAA